MQERKDMKPDWMEVGNKRDLGNGVIGTIESVKDMTDESYQSKGFWVVFSIPGMMADETSYNTDYFYPDELQYRDEWIARSGMPPEHISHDMSSFNWNKYSVNTSTMQNVVNAYISHYREAACRGKGLYICSKTKGSGKTMLACCIANQILRSVGTSLKYINAADYISLITDKAADRTDKSQYMTCGLLIFDDIGAQDKKQAWIDEALFRLIDKRYRDHLVTIFTSNIPYKDLQKNSDRIFSRIHGMSLSIIMPEESVRDQMAENENDGFLQSILNR